MLCNFKTNYKATAIKTQERWWKDSHLHPWDRVDPKSRPAQIESTHLPRKNGDNSVKQI